MGFIDRLKNSLGFKASEARVIASMQRVGQPITSKANYESFAEKGYNHNAIVHTSISKITTAAKSVDWVLYQKGRGSKRNWIELENHPFLELWNNPNPMQSTSDFIEAVIGFKKIAGNSYVEANRPNPSRPPVEIWPVRPDKMRIVPGTLGYPLAFEFCYGGQKKQWFVDQTDFKADILHMKYFNPTDDWYGLSPIQAFLLSLDQYNHANRWNLALLQNEARPSGVLQMSVTKDNPRGALTDTQYQQLKQQVEERSGSWNAGRPLILQGGLEWKQMSLSPKDMDFLNAKSVTANDILMVYGVPSELVGIGQKTFNNYAEARLSFYEETVLPTLDSFKDNINQWLLPMFGDNLHLDYDEDSIPALVEKREKKFTSLAGVSYLTENEKREAIGYAPVPGFDVFRQGTTYYHADEFMDLDAIVNDRQARRGSNENPEPQEQDDISTSDSSEKLEFKSINLINNTEKRKSWQNQNRLREALERPFARELEKDFNSLVSKLSESASKLNTQDKKLIEFALLNELDSWASDTLDATLRKNIETSLRRFARNIFRDGKDQGLVLETKAFSKFDDFVLRYVEQFTGTQISTIKNTNQKKIKKIVSEWVADTIQDGSTLPELSKYLEMEFEGLSKTNAMRIARTEVATASNAGLLEAAKELEIPNMKKEWISATDERTRNSHIDMNGQRVGVDEKFLVDNPDGSPDEMDGPGDTTADPSNFINCRCVLTFSGGN
jgi:HK97 family phage portal protein